MKRLTLGWVVAVAGMSFALAQEDGKRKDTRFEKIKKLAGKWAMADDKDKKVAVTYRVTARGSAVIETVFAGTENEMVSVYHMDGDKLVMTHYCMVGNQPRMRAAKEIKEKKLAFKCTGVSNTESHDDGHMHALTLTFTDRDNLRHDWTFAAGGKPRGTKTMNLVRKKQEE